MYINISKIINVIFIIIGVVILGFGMIRFILSNNLQLQIAASLVAIFGLQFIWFAVWLRRSSSKQK